MSPNIRRAIASVCHTLGVVWAAAGALRLIFGVRITFPLFPPIDLARVAVAPSLAIALLFLAAGAWLRRSALAREAESPLSGTAAADARAASR
jgi:hypothetical protein